MYQSGGQTQVLLTKTAVGKSQVFADKHSSSIKSGTLTNSLTVENVLNSQNTTTYT